MKSRKNYKILLFLLISIFCVSIGYATITGISFTIGGTAHAKYDGDVLVKYSNLSSDIETSSSCLSDSGTISNCATINASVTNNKTANFTVSGLKGYGDTATVKYKIINESENRVALNISATTNNNTEYFSLSTSLSNGVGEILNPNESTILTIKTKVSKVLYNGLSQTANVTVTISPSIVS